MIEVICCKCNNIMEYDESRKMVWCNTCEEEARQNAEWDAQLYVKEIDNAAERDCS